MQTLANGLLQEVHWQYQPTKPLFFAMAEARPLPSQPMVELRLISALEPLFVLPEHTPLRYLMLEGVSPQFPLQLLNQQHLPLRRLPAQSPVTGEAPL
jgi:hypothetical protein